MPEDRISQEDTITVVTIKLYNCSEQFFLESKFEDFNNHGAFVFSRFLRNHAAFVFPRFLRKHVAFVFSRFLRNYAAFV